MKSLPSRDMRLVAADHVMTNCDSADMLYKKKQVTSHVVLRLVLMRTNKTPWRSIALSANVWAMLDNH